MRSPSAVPGAARREPRARRPLALLVAAALAATPLAACAQQPAPRLPGPVMLKRIAEALDGNRTGAPVWVVASYDATNPVLGVLGSQKAADALARRSGPNAAVFGPYQAELDPSPFLSACVHDGKLSRVEPARCAPPVRPTRLEDVAGMTLLLTRADGSRDSIPIPAGADAIFLGMPAVDKFVVPYYVRTLGLQDVGTMRREFEQAFGGSGAASRKGVRR